jgi:uncharacterized protein YdcH (DUF465 family)
MNSQEQEVKEQLMATDENFARLAREHSGYDTILKDLASRSHLTEDEQIEEHRIKKLKLALKDQMEDIIHRHLQAV